MKKHTFLFLAVFVFGLSLVSAAIADASFTLNAHVRGITLHGFVENLPEDSENNMITILEEFLTTQEVEALGPTAVIEKSRSLTLGYDDITDLDFGDEEYEGVAHYLFLSNMTSALSVSFKVSEFINQADGNITVPWKLRFSPVSSEALIFAADREIASDDVPHTIMTATSPTQIRWGILVLSLLFAEGAGNVVSGDYTATVVASITAS